MLRAVQTPNWFRSQAFSTSQRFPHGPSSTALFHTATVPGLPPSESSPREDRVPFSGPLAPLQLSTVLRNVPPVTLSPEVSPTPTLLTQLPGSSTNYGSPFHASADTLPGRPGSRAAEPFLPPASPASKLCSLHESVRTASSCPEPSGRYSLGLLPLLRFSTAQASDPRPAWPLADPSSRPLPKDRTRDSRDR
jgi:hypothetical protein